MTTEKEPFEGDELVTGTYRELGVEKAPERLNQSILRMASGGKQSPARGFLFAPWMKPVAWAATIGLSLAIVLELTQVPTVGIRPDNIPTPERMQEEAVLQDADALKKEGNRARLQSGPIRQLISEDELGRSAARVDDIEVLSREPKGKIDAVAAPAPAEKSMVSDLFLLEQKETDTADSCEAAVRISRESWLECIEKLRETGNEQAADREYEAFILEYSVESRDLEGNK
jgi:biotin operon repressor